MAALAELRQHHPWHPDLNSDIRRDAGERRYGFQKAGVHKNVLGYQWIHAHGRDYGLSEFLPTSDVCGLDPPGGPPRVNRRSRDVLEDASRLRVGIFESSVSPTSPSSDEAPDESRNPRNSRGRSATSGRRRLPVARASSSPPRPRSPGEEHLTPRTARASDRCPQLRESARADAGAVTVALSDSRPPDIGGLGNVRSGGHAAAAATA